MEFEEVLKTAFPKRTGLPNWLLGAIIGALIGTGSGWILGEVNGAIAGFIVGTLVLGVIAHFALRINPDPPGSFLYRLHTAENPVTEWKTMEAERWAKFVGPVAFMMVQDRGECERRLRDTNPMTRRAALCILEDIWEAVSDVAFARICEELAMADPDPLVQGFAFMILGRCYEQTQDRRIGNLLAKVVLDDSRHSDARLGAYIGLHCVRGLRPTLFLQKASFNVPNDFDREFVVESLT
jgi:hypothetical protein